ncbi:TetR/AcrR family transcriptional regulator [Myxococcaceae bacterium JPH2]|nr:TetR/AcrR family transcriptional regulator [Myxococcaceae bacterium JPH2]
MSDKEPSVRERILVAAITCIERDGLDATGIREIAREAQVNSAAINYYFQGKEKLIALALEQTLEQAFGNVLVDFDQLRAKGLGIRAAFEALLDELMMNWTAYPRIAHAHFREALVHQRYEGAVIQRVNAFLAELAPRLAPATPQLSEVELRLALSQLWSSMYLLAMMPRLFDSFVALDFRSDKTRRAWVKQALRGLFTA